MAVSGERRNRALSTAQVARFGSAMELLQSGRTQEAIGIARSLVQEAPEAADAHQLFAMCCAGAGDATVAEAAFRRALALAPKATVVALNFASWLGRSGRLQEGIRVLEQVPDSLQASFQMGLLALQAHDHARARDAFTRVTSLDPTNSHAWDGLGNALHAMGEHEASAEAFRKAIEISPGFARAWINLGVSLRLLGMIEDALACFRRAEAIGHSAPELQDAINGTLQDSGQTAAAIEGARRLAVEHPGYPPGHETLARLLWENGERFMPGVDPLSIFRDAAEKQPGNAGLQRSFVRTLLSARLPEEAWRWLERMDWASSGDPVIEWFAADAMDALGRMDEAGQVYERLQRSLGASSPEFLNAHARNSFRCRRFDLAERCACMALELDPHNQEAWSHLGTAWRLAGDPREEWLFDYERLVGYVEVEPPACFPARDAHLVALAHTLERMHLAGCEPINQSVRGGSQTSGRLFGRSDPILRATAEALSEAVTRWLATLPETHGARPHPFLSRRRTGIRFTGSWSVRLTSSGRHANHIHNQGWMSSAFYVSLPSCMNGEATSDAGWIQFGQPMDELGLDLPPRRLIRPEPGHLALFPSYTWHGTVPFVDTEPRLTIAFDMQPA